jgi:predicted nicotinamide N-methyase
MFSGPHAPPSGSLPPVRSLVSATEEQINSALRDLKTLYCPLRLPTALPKAKTRRKQIPEVSTPVPADSGYASQDEEDGDDTAVEEIVEAIRADPFERNFATRWLTSLLSRSAEMDLSEEAQSRITDDAAFILASFSDSNAEEEEALTRKFSFATTSGETVEVTLNDAPLSGTDHTDVGLQSWGASIVLSDLMCSNPERYGLKELPGQPTIIELGAGTGLVSLTLAKLLPNVGVDSASITATDYHPTVLENLQANITTNFPRDNRTEMPLSAAALDWSTPPPELHCTAQFLVASDVVYAPQHASWLRDCAAHLMTSGGTFWLMVTVRQNGKFEGIPETVESAFVPEHCPRDDRGRVFTILEKETIEKRRGIGRGDEQGYNLYRIGWTSA